MIALSYSMLLPSTFGDAARSGSTVEVPRRTIGHMPSVSGHRYRQRRPQEKTPSEILIIGLEQPSGVIGVGGNVVTPQRPILLSLSKTGNGY
uniref:Uncharacterized protein n=1 Tax=Vespula pensylvanica TaxID=30213 RepID=A0A834NY52_VESPE|nr:hypothetical protein H0235_009198 [Vespula pensylvanica]